MGDDYNTLDQTIINDDFASTTINPVYDANGNLTDDGIYVYKYDAWNRLVQAKRKTAAGDEYAVVGTYRYDGLGRRIYKKVEHCGSKNRQEFFYYDSKWRLLEIRNATDKPRQQFVWGSQYIDELICMDVDTDGDGDCTDLAGSPAGARRFFYCQDANYNVVALREGGTIIERYEYDAYGTVRVVRGWDSSKGCESGSVVGESLKWQNPDLFYELPSNPLLYAGYYYDDETGLYHIRNRMYDPCLQRMLQRDPAGYMDTMNLYAYAHGDPIGRLDSLGLWGIQIGSVSIGIGQPTLAFDGEWASNGPGDLYSGLPAPAEPRSQRDPDPGVPGDHCLPVDRVVDGAQADPADDRNDPVLLHWLGRTG